MKAGDDVEGHVDTGGDAGGGDDVALVDDAFVGADVDGGVVLAEPVDRAPVGGGALAVEETVGGEEEGTGADASGE